MWTNTIWKRVAARVIASILLVALMQALLYAGLRIRPLEEFWARLMAWVTPNSTYVFAPGNYDGLPHNVRMIWPAGMKNTPPKAYFAFATGCTGVDVFVALIPFFVRKLRVLEIIRSILIAVAIAAFDNFFRLLLIYALVSRDFPSTENPFELHDLVHSGFSVATWLLVVTGYTFVQWKRATLQRSAVSA